MGSTPILQMHPWHEVLLLLERLQGQPELLQHTSSPSLMVLSPNHLSSRPLPHSSQGSSHTALGAARTQLSGQLAHRMPDHTVRTLSVFLLPALSVGHRCSCLDLWANVQYLLCLSTLVHPHWYPHCSTANFLIACSQEPLCHWCPLRKPAKNHPKVLAS